jgi:hypothetical protein
MNKNSVQLIFNLSNNDAEEVTVPSCESLIPVIRNTMAIVSNYS